MRHSQLTGNGQNLSIRFAFSRPPVSLAPLLLLLILLSGCAGKQDLIVSPAPPQVTDNMTDGVTIFDHDGKNKLAREEFATALLNFDYVLVGERHDSEEQHKAQLFVLETLGKTKSPVKNRPLGKRIALGLEMLPFTEQPRLDALHRRNIKSKGSVSLMEFARKIDWKRNWGYDIQLYAAPLEFALEHKIPIVGLNASQAMVKAVRQHEISKLNQLSKKEKADLGLPDNLNLPELIPPTESQQARLRMIFDMHKDRMLVKKAPAVDSSANTPGNIPDNTLGKPTIAPASSQADSASNPEMEARLEVRFAQFMRTQSLWDTVMAQQAVKARAKIQGPMVIMAGAGHVEHGWGIAERLRIMDPEARIVLVLPTQQLVQNDTQTVPLLQEPVSGRQAADYYLLCKADAPTVEMPAKMLGPESRPAHKARLGLRLRMPEKIEGEQATTGTHTGLEVLEVLPNSRAETAGLKAGDVIIKAGDKPVQEVMDLHQAGKAAAEKGHGLKLLLKRGGKNVTVNIPTEK